MSFAKSWGANYIGNGSAASAAADPSLVSGSLKFNSLAIAFYSNCGVTVSGDAYCWGSNGQGHLVLEIAPASQAPQIINCEFISNEYLRLRMSSANRLRFTSA